MRPLIIGVAGGSGSGKTTIARQIDEAVGFDSVLVEMDAYYKDLAHLSLAERKKVNYDHPDAFDMDLLVAHLETLAAGEHVDKPTYDYPAFTRAATTIHVESKDVIIVEGIPLFVDVAERGRSMESVVAQYLTTVRPMHLEFVEPSKRWAHVILPEGGLNRIGVEMILARAEREAATRRLASQ